MRYYFYDKFEIEKSIEIINKIKKGEIDAIRLKNTEKPIHLVVPAVCMVVLWFLFSLFYKLAELVWSLDEKVTVTVLFIVLLINNLLLLGYIFFVWKYGDECYLTENCIVRMFVLYSKEKSTFVLEKKNIKGRKVYYINGIHPEIKRLGFGRHYSYYRFQIMERFDEAEKWVEENLAGK